MSAHARSVANLEMARSMVAFATVAQQERRARDAVEFDAAAVAHLADDLLLRSLAHEVEESEGGELK